MKKKFILFIIIINIIVTLSYPYHQQYTTAKAIDADTADTKTNYGYYKCLSSCILFKSSDITDMSLDNIYFIIPEGYFVKKINDISATTLKVSYNNKVGYVLSERVRLVSILPTIKYLEGITFDITNTSGTQLWRIPSSIDTLDILYKHVGAGTKNISYIASVNGEIPIGSSSSLWYYCSFSPESDPTSVYEGYIHSEKTTNLSFIPENTEDDIINNSISSSNKTLFGLSNTMQTILIVAISIPLLAIIVVLLLNSRRREKLKLENEITRASFSQDTTSNITDNSINQSQTRTHKINDLKGKKYSLKDSFNNFMFQTENQPTTRTQKNNFSFSSLDEIDDDELL